MDVVVLTILALACWRVTHLLVSDTETGPWDILETVRWYFGKLKMDKLIACPWCVSIWVGQVIAWIATFFAPSSVPALIVGLALSGFTMLVWKD